MTHIIESIVSPHGETSLETKGFAGASCQQASRFLERALGSTHQEKFTAEFHQEEAVPNRIQQGGGA